ncbi:hypothetical protein [sulfur-oxidizing endosymbiont of Gigantopelta aegis]|uniref:hypothetical protein n=1 Tax=sulfur-oxidizing endosymbiont of Gigantopelta aegis TaxID=2794934 RepID=UPI0018DC4577|nr:hypothetical protein [sulfur-oxidizing endosymbiont of Gigantopelta aegis]
MNKKNDLSRWNRAGLNEFRYIDGNAISYLETLRQELLEQYENKGILTWQDLLNRFPVAKNETAYQNKKRLNAQYYDERRDYAWEILRSFSRSAHVLGEYINAYANESYLPTAQEWDNVRKLVALLDYIPSPPASAETYIALLYKDNSNGIVDKGFAVKNKPDKGESSVIFESQDNLEGSSLINKLYLKNWNKNKTQLKSLQSFRLITKNIIRFTLSDDAVEINNGDVGVLATAQIGLPVRVINISNNASGKSVLLRSARTLPASFTLHNSTLYLQPEFTASPLPNGINSAELDNEISVATKDIIFSEKDGKYTAREVAAAKKNKLQFKAGDEPLQQGEKIHRLRTLKGQCNYDIDAGKLYLLANDYNNEAIVFIDSQYNEVANADDIVKKSINSEGEIDIPSGKIDFHYIKGNFGNEIYYADREIQAEILRVGSSKVTEISFSGQSGNLESQQWALIEHQDKEKQAYKITRINADEDSFSLRLDGLIKPIKLVRSAFKLALKHKNYNVNSALSGYSDASGLNTILKLEQNQDARKNNKKLLLALSLGKKIICACDTQAITVEIKDVKQSAQGIALYVSPAFHNNTAFTRHNTQIYGNVVRATHGETQAEKIVGNGDASQSSQCFSLSSDTISWVADSAFNTGVRADLSLRVGQRVWQQVADLSISAPEAHHYQVQVNEDNQLSICFGNAKNGRRLPTGIDNVRVRYRNGFGEQGNLVANALQKIVRPHVLIDSFIAPLVSLGGAEKETSSSMRENAPQTILTLSRAVSLADFTHLAAYHSMVWQAKAFEKMPDRPGRAKIEIVVVSAGGAVFAANSDTATLIQNYLLAHAAPGTPISVLSYKPLLMQVKVFIMIDEQAYDKKQVELAVKEHLIKQLQLKSRKLGQALFRSEVIALLEQVPGVENGHCEILNSAYSALPEKEKPAFFKGDDGKIRKLSIQADQLLYLDNKQYPIQLISQNYEP